MITPIYAAILALIFVVLSFRTLLLRRKKQIAIGSADDMQLTRATRVHANFSEYVPIALIVIYFLEQQTDSVAWIHVLCAALITGRVVHSYGVSQVNEIYSYRVVGMVLTLATIISASLSLLVSYVN